MTDYISCLPREVSLIILSFIDPKDLLRLAQVAKHWYDLTSDEILWKRIVNRRPLDLYFIHPKSLKAPVDFADAKDGVIVTGKDKQASSHREFYLMQSLLEHKWSFGSPTCIESYPETRGAIKSVALDDDKIVMAISDDHLRSSAWADLLVWSLSGTHVVTLLGHTGHVWCLEVRGDLVVSGSEDYTVRLWSIFSGSCLHVCEGHTDWVFCLHLHIGAVVSGSYDGTLRMWNIDDGCCTHAFTGHGETVRHVVNHGTMVISGSCGFTIKVWQTETEECLHTFEGDTGLLSGLVSNGEELAASFSDLYTPYIRVWNIKTGDCLHTFLTMNHDWFCNMFLSGKHLVICDDETVIKVRHSVTGNCLHSLEDESGAKRIKNFAVIGPFVLCLSYDCSLEMWRIDNGQFVRSFELAQGQCGCPMWLLADMEKIVCILSDSSHSLRVHVLYF